MRKISLILVLTIFCFISLMADLSDSLVAHYPFNGNANDESGNGHNGSVFGATLTYDRFGEINSAYSFDGTNDYIALDMHYADGASIPKFTVVVWYRTSASSSGMMQNWSFFDFDRSEWFNCYVRADNGKLAFSGADGINDNFDIHGNTVSNDGQWHQGVVIYDSDNDYVKFYVDGNHDGTVNYSNMQPISDNNTRYGIIGDGSEATTFNGSRNGFYYDGLIDDIRFYNRVLTETEIRELYFGANFAASQTVIEIGDSITFNDLSTGNPTSWEWDFNNDGSIDSYEQNPTWLYDDPGYYTVSLTVSDSVLEHTTTKENYIYVTDESLPAGLYAYYPFTGNANDLSGNGNHGDVQGAILCEDRFEDSYAAYQFDDNVDYIHLLTDSEADSLGLYFSVSVWFKSETTSGNNLGRIITRDRSDYWAIYAKQSQNYPQDLLFSYDNGSDYTLANAISQNSWHLATATWDLNNNEVKLYLDSELQNTFTFRGFSGSSRPIIIGDNTENVPGPGSRPFLGRIDDIRLYNRVLDADEVKELYYEGDWAFLANFTATPRFGYSSLEVSFSASSNIATDWEWDFQNDGTIDSYEQNPVFTYAEPGMYDVKLKATLGTVADSLTQDNYIIVQDSMLSAPQNPTIAITDTNAVLNWEIVNDANYYLIYKAEDPYGSFVYLDNTTETNYTHTNVGLDEVKQFYLIIGFDGTIETLKEFIATNREKNFNFELNK